MLISEDDVTETAQDLQAATDPGYHHEVNVIIVFLEHCMTYSGKSSVTSKEKQY